jgi:DNA-binding MarR family transcriptional regulator
MQRIRLMEFMVEIPTVWLGYKPNVTGVDGLIFYHIARSREPVRLADIVQDTGLSQPTVSRCVAALSTECGVGLVEYVSGRNRRSKCVRLAPKGVELADALLELFKNAKLTETEMSPISREGVLWNTSGQSGHARDENNGYGPDLA